MAGRPRLPFSTFGSIRTTAVGAGRYRAQARFRDEDGRARQVTAVGSSRNAAQAALKVDLAAHLRASGAGDSLNAGSPFPLLAQAWMEDVMLDVDRATGTKDVYQSELRGLVLPYFEHFTVREVTVGRIELFLRIQRAKYTRAKHSRTILSMVLAFAVRREIIPSNPVKETSRMKKPPHAPKALTTEQIAAIRLAAREWRTGEGTMGPRSDGQVRDIIEVMLGTATRIGEVLALRKCDVDIAFDDGGGEAALDDPVGDVLADGAGADDDDVKGGGHSDAFRGAAQAQGGDEEEDAAEGCIAAEGDQGGGFAAGHGDETAAGEHRQPAGDDQRPLAA